MAGSRFATGRVVHRRVSFHNPYAGLRALLEATRELSLEELAELQLELGYVDRALAIYERLLLAEPKNLAYRGRCEWLARLSMAQARRRRAVPAREAPGHTTQPGHASPPPPTRASILPLPMVRVR